MAGRLRESAPDNVVPVVLAAIAFGGSFAHWVKLAETHGQHGVEALLTAVCVDLGAFMCARERERDLKEGRKRKGWASWPSLGMFFAILLTLTGNVAGAQFTPWGVVVALIPGVFLLLAISLMERRANERHRRKITADKIAVQRAEAERGRRAEAEAEQARLAEAERQAAERRQRQLERQRELAERHSAIVTPSPLSVTPGPGRASPRAVTPAPRRLSLTAVPADGDGGSAARGVDVMRAYWDREVAAGRSPEDITGAELQAAAGLSPDSSLGRQRAARWRREASGSEASA